jgi:hypothetical protein
MIAARIARRSLIDRLFLDGMEFTDAHPSFGMIGAALTILLGLVLEKAWP